MYKYKKGFTLVELLAVIAILAILVIILLPNVIDLFNNAQVNSFQTEVQQIFRAAQQRFLLNAGNEAVYFRMKDIEKSEEEGKTVFVDTSTCANGKEAKNAESLELQGNTSIDYFIKLNSSGEVITLIVYNDSYAFSHTSGTLNIEDVGTGDNKVIIKSDDQNAYNAAVTALNGKCLTD